MPEGEARFWLYRVARNFALNELNKHNTRHRLFGKVVDAFRAHVPTPEEEFEMAERKERMIAASDAFVVLPGGLGTLDELLEVMTLRQLGFIDKPILLVDIDGYWQPFMRLFEQVVDEAFAEKDATSLVEVAGRGRAQ